MAIRLLAQRAAQLSAWLLLLLLAYFTLGPLTSRPQLTADPQYERFLAFGVLGILFGFAYPRRPIAVLAGVVGAAGILEVAQRFTGDRHGHVVDALAKAAGGVAGALAGIAVGRIWPEERAVPTKREGA